MGEMEKLIKELTESERRPSPSRVTELQKEIQQLQRQASGWDEGLSLLKRDESELRFYGALTLMVKIRTDGQNLHSQHEARNFVLETLIQSYGVYTSQSEKVFVLRKISSTLAALYVNLVPEYKPLRHISASFVHGSPVDFEQLDAMDVLTTYRRMSSVQLRSLIWLSTSIVEETNKIDAANPRSAKTGSYISENALDAWSLIGFRLQGIPHRGGFLKTEDSKFVDHVAPVSEDDMAELSAVFDAASIWMDVHSSWETHDARIVGAANIAISAITNYYNNSSIAATILSCLKAILDRAPKYMAREHSQLICTLLLAPQSARYVESLLQGNYEHDAVLFVEFLVSLLDIYDLSTPESLESTAVKLILELLRELLYTPGTAVVEDEVCQSVLDAFNQLISDWSDWAGNKPADEVLSRIAVDACLQFAVKVQYPPNDLDSSAESWDGDERAKFSEFRNDVQDLLLSSYACIGPELIDRFANIVQGPPTSPGWEDFEAQLFCLAAFSDAITNDINRLGHYILHVFASSRWTLLISNVQDSPERARQGAINFISHNTDALQQHGQFLLPCLDFLFASLHLSGSTALASRAISTLCHKQRARLVGALPQFLESASSLSRLLVADRSRLFSAVASVIQALPKEEDKAAPLERLLGQISAKSGSTAASSALELLQILAAVGKGLRAPADSPIEVDPPPLSHEHATFWTLGAGRRVQDIITATIEQALVVEDPDPALLEAVCEILRSGYTESHPNPFKLDPSFNTNLLVGLVNTDYSSIGVVIGTASAFLASLSESSDETPYEVSQIVSAITNRQRTLLESFAEEKHYEDHEFTYSSLDLFARTMPRHGRYFVDDRKSGEWQIIFEFALLSLENADTLPRRSAAHFWSTIFDLSSSLATSSDVTTSLSTRSSLNNLNQCLEQYGPRFVTIIFQLLSGHAARSELDTLSEPLRKFVGKHGLLASRLLKECAAHSNRDWTNGNVQRFIEQVLALRGARKTREVVRDFWIAGRGRAFTYTG